MVIAVAAHDTSGLLKKIEIDRRAVGANDVDIEIHYAGICHSDLHQICAEWPSNAIYPMVPGHEIVGVVTAVGAGVSKFKVGDKVGVGCIVDSCRDCHNCKLGDEQFCAKGMVGTYNAQTDWKGAGPKTKHVTPSGKEMTLGGYSQSIVVDENYVCSIPASMSNDLSRVAPLLCAGITTYSPLNFWGAIKKGKDFKVGVVGFGGLGHMGVKIAKAAGNDVTVISHSANKKAAVEALGAKFINSNDAEQMASIAGSLDLILDTVSVDHALPGLLGALKSGPGASLVMLGVPSNNLELHAFHVIGGRKSLAGSLIGGIKETQEMLEFCAKHNILPDCHVIHPKEANHAMVALRASNMPGGAHSRFVIDIKQGMLGDWEVEEDAGIDPKQTKVHDWATVIPPEARHPAHAK